MPLVEMHLKQPLLTPAAAWTCFPPVASQDSGNTAPVRNDGFHIVECLSYDGTNCVWGNAAGCQASIAAIGNQTLKPIKCTKAQMAAGSGWCYNGAGALGLLTGECRHSEQASFPQREYHAAS
jgi:hypothetical protein